MQLSINSGPFDVDDLRNVDQTNLSGSFYSKIFTPFIRFYGWADKPGQSLKKSFLIKRFGNKIQNAIRKSRDGFIDIGRNNDGMKRSSYHLLQQLKTIIPIE